jgi:L-lysine 6-transaminase
MCDSFNLPYAPTVVCSAKKMATGVVYFLNPLKQSGILDSTWSGSLVDMVRFVQEMKIVKREKLIEQVPEKSKYLRNKLKYLYEETGYIFNIRGFGLYQGFSMDEHETRNEVTETALQQENLLLMWAGTNSIRLRPNLSVSYEEIDLLAEKMNKILNNL